MDNESGVDKDILKTNPEQNSWQVCNTETDDIYFSDQDSDCMTNDIYESDTEEELSESESPSTADPEHLVNKTTLQYIFLQVAADCIRKNDQIRGRVP